jgi:hypothetical protein
VKSQVGAGSTFTFTIPVRFGGMRANAEWPDSVAVTEVGQVGHFLSLCRV